MSEVEDFIYQQDEEQRKIIIYLHETLTRLDLTCKIRYKVPFYYAKSWICYINVSKTGSVELSFTRGNELSNEQGLLDHKGRKQVFSLELKTYRDIPKDALNEIIQEALLLDETIPYASKRSKN